MRRRLAAGAVIAVVLLTSGVAAALDGDAPANTGWWSSEPGASAQPEGGFQVGAVGGSATSVAAVRFSTPSGVTYAQLLLQEASGGFVTPATSLQVCVTTAPWEPANPGAMADAPAADCAQKAPLTRDESTLVWSADVTALVPSIGGEPSLMIVPGETPGGGSPLDPGFRVAFSEAKLAITAADSSSVATPTTTFSGGTDFGSSGSSSSYDPGTAGGSISGIDAVTPTTTAPTPTTSSTIAQAEAFSPPKLAAGASPGGGGAKQPWARLLFLVPLSAAIGVGSVYLRRMLTARGVVEA